MHVFDFSKLSFPCLPAYIFPASMVRQPKITNTHVKISVEDDVYIQVKVVLGVWSKLKEDDMGKKRVWGAAARVCILRTEGFVEMGLSLWWGTGEEWRMERED